VRSWFKNDSTPPPLGPELKTAVDRRLAIGLFVFLAVVYGISMFTHGLIPAEEPRFAEVVREMIARGSWWVPFKNGLPYVEYPPLYYWLSIVCRLAGLPLRAAIRMPGTVAYLLWVFWMGRWVKSAFPDVSPTLPRLALAALPIALYNFFTAHTDSLLALGVLMAYTGYLRHRRGPGTRFPWELWSGLAIATMAKGPVGLAITLPAMGLDLMASTPGLWTFSREAWRALWDGIRFLRPLRGLVLSLGVLALWAVMAGLQSNWDFDRAFFIYQNFTRFLSGLDHEHGPFLYLKSLWGDFFPWAFLLPFGIVLAWRRRGEPAFRLALLWTLWTILFFSASVSKQSKYILPAAPAIVTLSLGAVGWVFGQRARVASRVGYGISAFLLVAAGFVALLVLPGWVFPGIVPTPGTMRGLPVLRGYLEHHPAPFVSYLYPAPPTIYALYPLRRAPIPFVRSARALYAEVRSGRIAAGSYLIVYRNTLPVPGRNPTSVTLSPPPNPAYFTRVLSIPAQGGLILYRVRKRAQSMPLPITPIPPPWHWWDQFDTD
jgi:4-amino-4-deoxy-L-arabinose transferase-like glycosyltransferase